MKKLLSTFTLLSVLAWSSLAGAYQKTIPVKGKADITVGTKSGDVKINGWDKNEVKVEADDDIGKYVLVDGDTIRIGVNEDGKIVRHITADIAVHVPAGSSINAVTISGDVSVADAAGRFRLKSVSGDVSVQACSGSLSLNSTSGDIKLSDLEDDLSFVAVSGDVVGGNIKGKLLEGKTVSGDITLKNVDASQLRLKTVSGEVSVGGKFAADGSVKIKTLSGNVDIRIPADTGFDVSARSRSGDVGSDFEMKVQESGEHQLEARAGRGGTQLDIGSFSGDIRIKKQ
jgi:DUF4097 and DUF4098 domain-containing protein YvlB